MQSVFSLFDAYTVRARIYPLIPILLPIYSVFVVGAQDDSDALLLVLFASPFLVYGLSQHVRDRGKAREAIDDPRPTEFDLATNPAAIGLTEVQAQNFLSRYAGRNAIRSAVNTMKDDKVVFHRGCVYGYRRNIMAVRCEIVFSTFLGCALLLVISIKDPSRSTDAVGALILNLMVAALACIQGSKRLVKMAAVDYLFYLVVRSK